MWTTSVWSTPSQGALETQPTPKHFTTAWWDSSEMPSTLPSQSSLHCLGSLSHKQVPCGTKQPRRGSPVRCTGPHRNDKANSSPRPSHLHVRAWLPPCSLFSVLPDHPRPFHLARLAHAVHRFNPHGCQWCCPDRHLPPLSLAACGAQRDCQQPPGIASTPL